jgi:TatD DNase family protein
MIDTHCHIDFPEYDNDRTEVIERAKNNLDAIILSGTNFDANERAIKYSKEHPNFIYPSLGFHPVTSQNSTIQEQEAVQNQIIKNKENICAIGEVGMDFFFVKDKSIRQKQREIFLKFVEIANEHKIPLLIHARDADKKALNIVLEYEDIPEIIFHCYSGSLKTAKRIMEHDNYHMSFSTMVCYSKHHQDLVHDIPLEFMLTETDSPYLAMTKEERNEPSNVKLAVKKIAEIKDIDMDIVDEITTNNAKKVFKI